MKNLYSVATAVLVSAASFAQNQPMRIGGGVPDQSTQPPENKVGSQFATVTFRVVDQFGNPVPNVQVKRFVEVASNEANSASARVDPNRPDLAPFRPSDDGAQRGANRTDATPRFQGLQATNIPWGTYAWVLERGDPNLFGETVNGSTRIYQGELQHLIVVSVTREIPNRRISNTRIPGPPIRGTLDLSAVSQADTNRGPIWVRLIPVYAGAPSVTASSGLGPGMRDIPVSAANEFLVFGEPVGTYILAVIQGPELMDMQQISFESGVQPAEFKVAVSPKAPAVLRVRAK